MSPLAARAVRGDANRDRFVSVILPTYNERANVLELIDLLDAHVESLLEVIVVDDDSPDGTSAVVAERARIDPRIVLVRRRGEHGLTSALDRGLCEARGAVVAWLDADLSMSPRFLPRMLELLGAYDVVVGSRWVDGGRDEGHGWVAKLGSRTICRFASTLLRSRIKDQTSGFIVARRETLAGMVLRGSHGEYCIDLLHRLERRGTRVCEVPYVYEPRRAGKSKTLGSRPQAIGHALRYVRLIVRLRLGR